VEDQGLWVGTNIRDGYRVLAGVVNGCSDRGDVGEDEIFVRAVEEIDSCGGSPASSRILAANALKIVRH
jgi:hypothetical protein